MYVNPYISRHMQWWKEDIFTSCVSHLLSPDNPALENLQVNRILGTAQQKFENDADCKLSQKVIDFMTIIRPRFFKLEN